MARRDWFAVTVTSDPAMPGQEIAQACAKLSAAGWTPTFIVPVWAGYVQVIATRPGNETMPPRRAEPMDPVLLTDRGLDLQPPAARTKKPL